MDFSVEDRQKGLARKTVERGIRAGTNVVGGKVGQMAAEKYYAPKLTLADKLTKIPVYGKKIKNATNAATAVVGKTGYGALAQGLTMAATGIRPRKATVYDTSRTHDGDRDRRTLAQYRDEMRKAGIAYEEED